jgi:hypothetical protein
VVTQENLLASERFWPYQLELTSPWQPKGRGEPLPVGTLAVLVRVQDSRSALIDFGRDGRSEVPVGKTDLLKRANQIRLGELKKVSPNLVHTIGTRLVDSESESIRHLGFDAAFDPSGFLAVLADPSAKDFSGLAASLAPLRGRHGVMTVLFPQGTHPDLQTREQLRALDWPVPFLMDQFREGYTRSLQVEGASLPAVILLSREGRVIFESSWQEGVAAKLDSALEKAFGKES